MLLSRVLSITPRRIVGTRSQSILSPNSTAREFKVVLDNGTVYVDQALAEALGWSPTQTEGVSLTLSGWEPHYFAIARTGTDSDPGIPAGFVYLGDICLHPQREYYESLSHHSSILVYSDAAQLNISSDESPAIVENTAAKVCFFVLGWPPMITEVGKHIKVGRGDDVRPDPVTRAASIHPPVILPLLFQYLLTEMAAQRITAAVVKELNRVVTGTAPIIVNNNNLESAVQRPAWTAHYNPQAPTHQLAAELAYGIIMNHPFADGNKRTAPRCQRQAASAIQVIGAAHSSVAQQAMNVDELAAVYAKALGINVSSLFASRLPAADWPMVSAVPRALTSDPYHV
ncbi:hypothetical protein BN946_scf185012.g8 [Trametes cinnabarina]|uniref:Fido domain-containing protein n=1 Tax=Pycnoporus cinnabarinus TaxID=5643 RepID=A0A060SMJ4_PYCCI|nr:hypothetical protein BN946_scf185012.g8 [Trametes cinnabarina]